MPVTRRQQKRIDDVLQLVAHITVVQPGQTTSALNGDGHSVYRKEFYQAI